MYKGYNLILEKNEPQNFFGITDFAMRNFDKDILKMRKNVQEKMEAKLEFPLDSDSNIDAQKIMNDWFPNYKADIFISHSHKDEKTAKRLAIWLKEKLGLTVFIDSIVWGSADDLLKKIDDEYSVLSRKGSQVTYNYGIRNYTTSHVHMMLMAALTEVINNTECLFFLNTPNSVSVREVQNKKTNSPWIYAELKMAGVIEKKLPKRIQIEINKELQRSETFNSKDKLPKFDYLLNNDLNKLKILKKHDLVMWSELIARSSNEDLNKMHPLDLLYGEERKKDL
ncbi:MULTISPECIES: toll/interleukin-1 receptor domain-containing protein [Enterococcus]|uniref:toll/interleukin-1 receptor domain-containing protein n=1 Tax=Enterococcus TaxID=1350 RepID=UPI00094BF94A|nr:MULTISPECIES: toll/interleukin-1 receptor domain-containing protein [Enterococcus]MDO6298697.1 toll/interleukin-1 receptor domain-containing protein [Enterococcus gallinarum]OQO82903.1 hypothetical protein BH748_15720 [Enterococcus casseliflavus]QDA38930.1 hypothetical protein FHK66_10700 [Enterococcus faecium]HAP6108747.1 hypothetical protein [Enterococcus faecium]HAP8278513.1 hypothetical protein [Enterococcus faecium]